jgi:hypothetical protein
MVVPQEPLLAKPTKVLMPIAPDERLWAGAAVAR